MAALPSQAGGLCARSGKYTRAVMTLTPIFNEHLEISRPSSEGFSAAFYIISCRCISVGRLKREGSRQY